jgi:hypothetical protein
MGESAEDLLTADPVLGEVDRVGWPGVSLGRCELAKSTVRPCRVVVAQVLGQHLSQMILIDDQRPVEELSPQGADDPFADAFALGACGGLRRILIPSAVNTASKEPVNWPARSLIRNLTVVTRWPRSVRTLRAACVVHRPSGFAVMPARTGSNCRPSAFQGD